MSLYLFWFPWFLSSEVCSCQLPRQAHILLDLDLSIYFIFCDFKGYYIVILMSVHSMLVACCTYYYKNVFEILCDFLCRQSFPLKIGIFFFLFNLHVFIFCFCFLLVTMSRTSSALFYWIRIVRKYSLALCSVIGR